MPLASGTRLGIYEIAAPIGVGGMGEVYRATDTKLGRDVAIKVIPESFAQDNERMARFQREAQILASLNHPNIAGIYGVEDRALVMELVGGSTLEERIAIGAIPIEEALPIAKQIAEALEYAHERGVVHRDLKPANIKITPEGRVKVLDFGLAKALTGESSGGMQGSSPTLTMRATVAGMIMGTAAYMSPEQAKGKPVDRRTDIWAFGVVLVEMLTGAQMYAGETPSEILAAVIMREPDFSRLPPTSPDVIRKLLRRCIDKDQQRRLRDIGEARIAIDEAISSPPAQEAPPAVATVGPPRRSLLPWAIAGALLAALVAVSFLHVRESPPEAPLVRLPLLPPAKRVFESIAISPDGKTLAFTAANPAGRIQLWIRPLDSLTAQPVADSDGASFPFWSPDSRSVGFFANQKLKKISASGGQQQTITTVAAPQILGATWSSDGTIIFSSTFTVLFRVSSAGGEAKALTSLDRSKYELTHRWPQFLPDGRHYIYTVFSSHRENTAIYLGSLDSNDRVALLNDDSNAVYAPGPANEGFLLFVRNGTLMAQPFDEHKLRLTGEATPIVEQMGARGALQQFARFTASSNGVLVYDTSGGDQSQLTWFDRTGKRLGTLGESGLGGVPRFSSDEKRVVVSEVGSSTSGDIHIIELARGTSYRFTFDKSFKLFPLWSADDSRILFASNRNGAYDLFQKATNGAGQEELLLTSGFNKYPTDVSPDGRFLLYTQLDPKTGFSIWILPLSGAGAKPVPLLQKGTGERNGSFSPDGKWITYSSDESGRTEVYARRFAMNGNTITPSDGQWQISNNGGSLAIWRRDGKELFYVSPDSRITAVTVKAGANLEIGVPQSLFGAHFDSPSSRLAVTRDGQRFLMEAPAGENGVAAATVVLNWTRALRQ